MTFGAGALGRNALRQVAFGGDADRFFRKAIEQAAAGNFDVAIDALHEVTKANPDYLQAWNAKAMLYRLIGNKKMAELCTETARSIESTR
jgi:Flp pilus assembly protein TadD